LLLCAVLSACSGSQTAGTGDAGYVTGKGVITTLAADERERPGELAGETLGGEQVALSDFAGKTVVVNVWGSWCPPCRAEAPDLVRAAERLRDDGVVFLGINSRDYSRAAARAFVRRYDVPYPSIYDPSGRTLLAFGGTLRPNSIPSTVVIDRDGRVAASVLGEVTTSTLVALVQEVSTGAAAAGGDAGDGEAA
jgi:thiol-disulfide isomerase/thioredoxin